VAALKFFLKVYKSVDLAVNPLLDLFSKGAQNLAPLPREKNEIWNPEMVLSWIWSQPLPTPFLSCAREVIALLLLATGWHVDDNWKLRNNVQVSQDGAVLWFAERRKCKIKGKFSVSQNVGRFSSCERICPIQVVLRFCNQATRFRKDENFLFISSTGKCASKDTMRHWIVLILSQAGIKDSAGSCGLATTSLACEHKRSIDAIMSSALWSSENTFRRFYHRSVLPVSAPLNLMGGD
jgi:hypothetical protein